MSKSPTDSTSSTNNVAPKPQTPAAPPLTATPAAKPPPQGQPTPPPGSPTQESTAGVEVKKSPFRFIIPIVIILLIIAGLGFILTRFVDLGGLLRGDSGSETVELTYWGLWEPNLVLDQVFTQFEEQNPGITVNYAQQSSADYRERLQNAIETGQGPDIFRYHHTWVPMLNQSLASVPEDIYSQSEFDTTFYPIATEWLKGSKGYLGIPLMFEGLGLFYNQDIMEAAGKNPPTTWEELRRTAKQLTVITGEELQRGGIALGTTNNVEHWPDIVGLMLLQNGADPQRPNNKNGQDAIKFYTLFSTLDRVWDSSMPPSTFAFAQEKAVMMIAPSWRAHDIHQQNPNLNFAIAPVPQLPDTEIAWASFWVEGVNARASKSRQQAAWKLLKFMSQPEQLRQFYTAASEVRLFGEPFSRVDMADQLISDPMVGSYIDTAPISQSWFLSSWTHDNGINDDIIKYYEDAVNAVIEGEEPDKVLDAVEQGVDQVLSRYNIR